MDKVLLTALVSAGSGLVGVIIGSILSLFGQYFLYKSENKKWQKEKRIEILRYKKENLEKKYIKYDERLRQAIQNDLIELNMGVDFMLIFPENVKKAFDKAIKNKNKAEIKSDYADVLAEERKSLLEIDKEIEEEVKK